MFIFIIIFIALLFMVIMFSGIKSNEIMKKYKIENISIVDNLNDRKKCVSYIKKSLLGLQIMFWLLAIIIGYYLLIFIWRINKITFQCTNSNYISLFISSAIFIAFPKTLYLLFFWLDKPLSKTIMDGSNIVAVISVIIKQLVKKIKLDNSVLLLNTFVFIFLIFNGFTGNLLFDEEIKNFIDTLIVFDAICVGLPSLNFKFISQIQNYINSIDNALENTYNEMVIINPHLLKKSIQSFSDNGVWPCEGVTEEDNL